MILRGLELVGEDGNVRDVAISGAWIERVTEHRSTLPGGREPVLDFGGAIAFPGLVNSHDHLEFDIYPSLGHERYVDCRAWGDDIHRRDRERIAALQSVPKASRLRWGGLKNLLSGVTRVAHHGDARDELRGLPIECVAGTSIHSVRGVSPWRWRARLNAPVSRPPYVFHVGEGTSRDAEREIDELIRWNLFRRDVIGVHAIAMTARQAKAFRAVVWCPVSNEFLYGKTADVAALKRCTTVLFGTDATLSADWNMWNHLRRARALGCLEDRELFAALTRSAALVWPDTRAGRVAPGYAADVVVAEKKAGDVFDAFFALDPEDILLVLRNGAPVLYDASISLPPEVTLPCPGSLIRLGTRTKWVAEDVAHLLECLSTKGIASNLPFACIS